MPFASASSTHPVSAHATGEIIGQVLEQLGTHPDVVFLFATPGHGGALEDITTAVRAVLSPIVLLGAVGRAVIGRDTPRLRPALAALAGLTGPVVPLRWAGDGLPDLGPAEPRAVLLFAPRHPGPVPPGWGRVPVAGAVADHTFLVTEDARAEGGGVGVAFGGGVDAGVLVAEGFRPIGSALVVTDAAGPAVRTLSGQAARACLVDVARDQVPASDIELINRELYLGVVGEPAGDAPGGASGLARVLGSEPDRQTLVLAEPIDEGAVVQFHVRDRAAADLQLRHLVAEAGADAALVFPPTGTHDRDDSDDQAGNETEGPAVAGLATKAAVSWAGGPVARTTEAATAMVFYPIPDTR